MRMFVLFIVALILTVSVQARTVKFGNLGSASSIDTTSVTKTLDMAYIPCDTTVFIFEVGDTVTVDYLVINSYGPNGMLALSDTLYKAQTINNNVQLVGGYIYPKSKVFAQQKVVIKYKGKTKGKGKMFLSVAYIKENSYE